MRAAGTGNDITSLSLGTIQAGTPSITLPPNANAIQVRTATAVSSYATFKIVNASNVEVPSSTIVDNTMKVVVTAENGVTKTYSILTTGPAMVNQTLSNYVGTVASYPNALLTIDGNSFITITATDSPIKGSRINLTSEDVWLYFPGIRPSVFYASYGAQLQVNGLPAIVDQNIRVEQYLQGTMVISHPSSYQALQAFSGENLTGTNMLFGINTYYHTSQLGTMNNVIKSFRLKKGYMATFAQNDDGTGISQVYVAYDKDIVINKLPTGLYNDVSFVRALPWRWVAKKGWTNGIDAAQALNCYWNYDWDNAATSTMDIEYVPMRHDMNWNSYANINNKLKSTHSLGFNEPDKSDQANVSVKTALSVWPEMLKSGLRVGSPCPSDASAGLDWLYAFIDSCDRLHYRVDFIPVHWYKGGQTAKQFYDWLKAINLRTKRPIWITEWNNGANWTCCTPTYASEGQAVADIIHMMDTTSFVERYSIYEWVGDTRAMFYEWPVSLTPGGVAYKGEVSPLAYNPNKVTSISLVTSIEEEPTLETEAISALEVYPNPIENTVSFQTPLQVKEVAVYSLSGNNVQLFKDVKDNRVNMEGLPSGVYLLKVFDGENTWVRKVAKK
jgi:hypothetical protein